MAQVIAPVLEFCLMVKVPSAMKKLPSHLRSTSRAIALEPRILFDGAGAVAAADYLIDDARPQSAEQTPPPAVESSAANPGEGDAGVLLEGADASPVALPSSLGERLGLEAASGRPAGAVLLVVDTRVADYQSLLTGLPADVQVLIVDSGESGLDAIGSVLASGGEFDAVHILSHGDAGSLTLGSDQLDGATLAGQSARLQGWAAYLSADADILLYGCEVAQGEQGQSFIDELAHLTGADIAASIDATGAAVRGGNWLLEAATGSIEAGLIFNPAAMAGYSGLMQATAIVDADAATQRITAEDTTLIITGLSVESEDAGDVITLTIGTTGGISTLGTTSGLTVLDNGSAAITVSGTIADINAALATLTYTPDTDQNSSTSGFSPTITLNVTAGGAGSLTVTNISVTAVNDAPSLSGVALTVAEGGEVNLSLAQLAANANALDPDIATGQQVIDQLMVTITSLSASGTLTYRGGAAAVGMVIPVTDLNDLKYRHDGTDLAANAGDSFGIQVSDGGGAVTAGIIDIVITPRNVAPTISGSPTLIEGQVKRVAPSIALGDSYDTLVNATIVIDNVQNNGQGALFYDANDNGVVDAGEEITGSRSFTGAEAAALGSRLKFAHNGAEPNAPGAMAPSYRIAVTDAGGGEGAALTAVETVTIEITPNNDDPLLTNVHDTEGNALTVDERTSTGPVLLTRDMLLITDADLNPANTSQATLPDQLVYTIGTRPTQGELQLFVGGGLGPDDDNDGVGDGWIVLGDGGRFTQADIDNGRVRYYQTTNVTSDTPDNFTFTVRDSAFGYDLTDPTELSPAVREGAVRDTGGNIEVHAFHFNIVANPGTGHDHYEGDPRPATPGYGGSNLSYDFYAVVASPGNQAAGVDWDEAGGGYAITSAMLNYQIARTDNNGTPDDPLDDVRVAVPPGETVYTLTAPPGNGVIERQVSPGVWVTIPTNGQFTQADINAGNIRFVHDGSENHTDTFGYTVSDGTPHHYDGTFAIDVTPTNDRPVASGGATQVSEGNGNSVRLVSGVLGMSDVDGSNDPAKRTGEGAEDFLWFRVTGLPAEGTLQRWNGSAWVAVDVDTWLPATLLGASADGGTSGLRYVHDGSEPLTYAGGPKVTFDYVVRDDLANPADPFATNGSAPADISGSAQSNQSAAATVTINVVPVNSPPQVAATPGAADPTIGETITGGGAITGVNEILANVPEGGSAAITAAHLTAIDPDNTTTQRQFRLTAVPTEGTLLLNGSALGVGSTFTQSDIDNNRLSYRHGGSEVKAITSDGYGSYHDRFLFVVSDGVAETGVSAFLITLTPRNDRASVSAPSSLDVLASGGTPVSVPGVSVADTDLEEIIAGSEEDFLRVEVQVLDSGNAPAGGAALDYGAADPAGGRAYVDGKGSNTLVIQGTRAQVNAALATLTVAFSGDEDSSGHKIRVTVDDRLYTSAGTLDPAGGANGGVNATENGDGTPIDGANNRVSRDIALVVSNSNDPPSITNGSSYSVNEDALLTLNGFALADVDSFDRNVTVVAQLFSDAARTTLAATGTEGRLTYSGLTGVTASGNDTSTVTLTGTLADVQAALNQLQFDNANDFNGTGAGNGTLYLRATLTDFGHADVPDGHSVFIDKDITIVPVNDAPVLTVPGNQVMASGTYIDISSGFGVQDTRDTAQGATDYIEVTLAATAGGSSYGALTIQTPGTATVDDDGTHTIVVRGTSAAVSAALNSLRYTPDNANVDQVVTIAVTADDQANGAEGVGVGGNRTATDSFTITVSGINDAPVVTVPVSVSVAEDSGATTIAGISYADLDDFGGVQQVTLSVDNGALGFGTTTGLTVIAGAYNSDTVTVEGTKAALNAALATLTYRPTANYHGGDTLTVEVNDRGHVGTGGAQTDIETVAITVTPVNDRPTATTNVTLTAIAEDITDAVNTGTVLTGASFGYSDATDDQAGNGGGNTATGFSYFAIVANAATAAQGSWQVADGSSGWITVPTSGLGITSALVFSADRAVRFVPAADFNGTPGSLTVRVADGSNLTLPVSTSGSNRYNLNDTANGDLDLATGSWNNANRTIGISITAVNDAPTRAGADPGVTVDEDAADPAGQTVATLFGANFSDARDQVSGGSSANGLAGIAITGLASDEGVWEYRSGGGWTAVPDDVAADNALVLAASAELRFRPTSADYNGTPVDALTVRLIDDSAGAVTSGGRVDVSGANAGGSTQYSDAANAVTLGATVQPRNDAPAFTHTATNPAVTENGDTGTGTSIDPVKLLNSGSVSDPDLGTTAALDSAIFGGGSITVTLTDGIGGDVLQLDGLLAGADGIAGITGGGGSTPLVITLAGDATVAQVEAILEAIEYTNTSDDPTDLLSGTAKTSRSYTIVLSDGNNAQAGGNAGGPGALTATVSGTVTITAANDPPLATDDSNSVAEDTVTPVTGNVRTDGTADSDPDTPLASLTVTGIRTGDEAAGGPATLVASGTNSSDGTRIDGLYGTLVIGADGSYSYTLDNDDPDVQALIVGEQLFDRFTYTLSDGSLTDTATLTITIDGANDPVSIDAALDHTGGNGNPNDHRVFESGLADGSAPDDADITVNSSIRVTLPDGMGSTGRLTIHFVDADDVTGGVLADLSWADLQALSSASPRTVDTLYGTLSITGIVDNGDGTFDVQYTYVLTDAPANTVADPDDLFDRVRVTATDRDGDSSTATIVIEIGDDAPQAGDDTGAVAEGATLTVPAAAGVLANDDAGADGWAAGGAVVGVVAGASGTPTSGVGTAIAGSYGTLTLQADGSYVYVADPDSTSVDVQEVFTYTVRDADGDETTATLTIDVGNVTVSGTATSGSVDESGLAGGSTAGSGHTITDASLNLPAGQTALISTGTATYGTFEIKADGTYSYTLTSPTSGDSVTDSFTYAAEDANGNTVTNTVTITIVDDVPTAVADSASIDEDAATPVTGNVLGGAGAGSGDQSDTLGADGASAGGAVTGIAFDGTPGTVGSGLNGAYGTLTIAADGSYSYAVDNGNAAVQALGIGATLTETFSYTITDGDGDTATATLTLTIRGMNDAPATAGTLADQGDADGDTVSISTAGGFTDIDGDTLTYSASGLPPGLSIDPNTGIIGGTLTPSASQGGPGNDGVYTVTVTVDDGNGGTASQTFTYTVANPAPVAGDDSVVTAEDTPVSGNVLDNDRDADGDTLTVTGFTVGGSSYGPGDTAVIAGIGTLVIDADGSYTFTPAQDWNGTVPTVTYALSDGEGGTDTATLTIIVTPVNDVPITADTLTSQSDADGDTVSIPTAGGFTDIDGDTLTYSVSGLPAGLSIDPNTGIIGGTLTPSASQGGPGNDGVYTVTVTVDDGNGGTASQTFTYTVANPAPVAGDDSVVTAEDTPVSGNVLDNDRDADGDTLTVTGFTVGGSSYGPGDTAVIAGIGTLIIAADGSYTFTPAQDWNGTVPTVTYALSDGEGGVDTATLTIIVTPVDDVPVAVDDSFTTVEGKSISGDLGGNDTPSGDGGSVWSLGTPPTHGTVTVDPDGTFTYIPDPGYVGADSFTYAITDADGSTSIATVTLVVAPGDEQYRVPVEPFLPPNPGSSTSPSVVPPVVPWLRPQAGEPSVYFYGDVREPVVRLPIPLHPALFVNRQVNLAQQEREQSDLRADAAPDMASPMRWQSDSLANGLGLVPGQFVLAEVANVRSLPERLDSQVKGRLSRLSLGSDGLIGTPELRQPDPALLLPPVGDAPRETEETAAAVAAPRWAPSFTDQLRGGGNRLPLAARASIHSGI